MNKKLTLYHGTSLINLKKIKKEGLVKGSSLSNRKWLAAQAANMDSACRTHSPAIVLVFKVNKSDVYIYEDEFPDGLEYISKIVLKPKKYIRLKL